MADHTPRVSRPGFVPGGRTTWTVVALLTAVVGVFFVLRLVSDVPPLVAGGLALVVGVWFPYGGAVEASASVVFGLAFVIELGLGYRAIRDRRVLDHRRWMIRAFALALGVGTIRLRVGLFTLLGILSITANRRAVWFGVAFWIAFTMHALVAELYLRRFPRPGAT